MEPVDFESSSEPIAWIRAGIEQRKIFAVHAHHTAGWSKGTGNGREREGTGGNGREREGTGGDGSGREGTETEGMIDSDRLTQDDQKRDEDRTRFSRGKEDEVEVGLRNLLFCGRNRLWTKC